MDSKLTFVIVVVITFAAGGFGDVAIDKAAAAHLRKARLSHAAHAIASVEGIDEITPMVLMHLDHCKNYQ